MKGNTKALAVTEQENRAYCATRCAGWAWEATLKRIEVRGVQLVA